MSFGDVIRSGPSPQALPQEVGGNFQTIWHCKQQAGNNFWELSIVDFSSIRINAAHAWATGAGGDSDTIWSCENNIGIVATLSLVDFSTLWGNVLGGIPLGMGGDANTVWFSDIGWFRAYELSSMDLSIVRTGPPAAANVYGIGGNASVIWHSVWFPMEVRELSIVDLTVVQSAPAPAGAPTGIGGDVTTIWHCDNVTDLIYELGSAYNAPTAPTGLLCNGRTNPVDLTTKTPFFSAIYNDPDTGDIAQNYRIQVNTESDFSGTMLWDSGKTGMSNVNEGERCANINYGGSALTYDITYYWRIKFWDDENLEGAWSSAAYFSIIEEEEEPPEEEEVAPPERENPVNAVGKVKRARLPLLGRRRQLIWSRLITPPTRVILDP